MKKWTPPTVTAVLCLALFSGCSEETQDKMGNAADATGEAAESMGRDIKDTGGELKDQAEGALTDLKENFRDETTETQEQVIEQAGEAAQNRNFDKDELLEQARNLINNAESHVNAGNFAKAQAALDQVKGMPGYEQLGDGIKDQITSLEAMIDKGMGMTTPAPADAGQ